MARKKKHEEHENHERWLVSYADFITLLFAFFTVLYATAQTDQEKLEAVVNGMNAAFDGGVPFAVLQSLTADPTPPNLVETNLSMVGDTTSLVESLKRGLRGSLSDNVVQIGEVNQSLVVVLPARLAFAPGSADLHPAAFAALSEIARVVDGTPTTLEVTGHADATPLSPGSPFEDNWALAAARAANAARYLERRGIDQGRITIAARIAGGEEATERAVSVKIRVDHPRVGRDVTERLDRNGLLPSE